MADVMAQNGDTLSGSPTLRRRVSMEEDYFYQEVISTTHQRRASAHSAAPSEPPMYHEIVKQQSSKGKGVAAITITECEPEQLPAYSCEVHAEGVFQRKQEIENTNKRAEDRNWRQVYVELTGTVLNVYQTKKDWGWGRTGRSGPNVSPDNPPWVRKTELEKSYTLLHADVGIAADYEKRRYVIRVRAEADQFLLSCIELPTFVRWLDALFAAIAVAAPIDEREFPRDQSIPRVARIRYFRGETGGLSRQNTRATEASETAPSAAPSTAPSAPASPVATSARPVSPLSRRPTLAGYQPPSVPGSSSEAESSRAVARIPTVPEDEPISPAPLEMMHHRLSTTSYPNSAIVPETGKWRPRHQWTSAHDMVYAKLCYAVLLFRSPRKSNYIIMKGKQWFVDWATGKMVRVLPPGYGEAEITGPFQQLTVENRRL